MYFVPLNCSDRTCKADEECLAIAIEPTQADSYKRTTPGLKYIFDIATNTVRISGGTGGSISCRPFSRNKIFIEHGGSGHLATSKLSEIDRVKIWFELPSNANIVLVQGECILFTTRLKADSPIVDNGQSRRKIPSSNADELIMFPNEIFTVLVNMVGDQHASRFFVALSTCDGIVHMNAWNEKPGKPPSSTSQGARKDYLELHSDSYILSIRLKPKGLPKESDSGRSWTLTRGYVIVVGTMARVQSVSTDAATQPPSTSSSRRSPVLLEGSPSTQVVSEEVTPVALQETISMVSEAT